MKLKLKAFWKRFGGQSPPEPHMQPLAAIDNVLSDTDAVLARINAKIAVMSRGRINEYRPKPNT